MSEVVAHAVDEATASADAAAGMAEHAADQATDAAQESVHAAEVAAAHAAHAPVAVADAGAADLHQALGRIEARVDAIHEHVTTHTHAPAAVEHVAETPVAAVEEVAVPAAGSTPEGDSERSGRRGVGFKNRRRQ